MNRSKFKKAINKCRQLIENGFFTPQEVILALLGNDSLTVFNILFGPDKALIVDLLDSRWIGNATESNKELYHTLLDLFEAIVLEDKGHSDLFKYSDFVCERYYNNEPYSTFIKYA